MRPPPLFFSGSSEPSADSGVALADFYVDRKPDKAELPAICMCKLPERATDMGCGSGCINRCVGVVPFSSGPTFSSRPRSLLPAPST